MKHTSKPALQTVIACIAIQLCLGTAYLWSLFQTGIAQSIFGGDNAPASLTFSLILCMTAIGGLIAGKLSTKYSLSFIIRFSGVLSCIGLLMASRVTEDAPLLLWLGYGILTGLGMAIAYSASIACAQRWYPEKKGFITGVIVSALGFGGVIFTPVIEMSIIYFGGAGIGEVRTFFVLAIVFLLVSVVSSIFIIQPPSPSQSNALTGAEGQVQMRPSQMLRDIRFYLIACTFALGCIGGMMMITFAKPIAEARGLAATASIGVVLISLFNSGGRLACGILSDKLGRYPSLLILLCGSTIFSLSVNVVTGYAIYLCIGCIGFFYGGLLTIFPPITADLFGTEHYPINYGFVLLGFGVGGVTATQVSSYYKNLATYDISLMSPAFYIAATCSFVGILLVLVLRKLEAKKT